MTNDPEVTLAVTLQSLPLPQTLQLQAIWRRQPHRPTKQDFNHSEALTSVLYEHRSNPGCGDAVMTDWLTARSTSLGGSYKRPLRTRTRSGWYKLVSFVFVRSLESEI